MMEKPKSEKELVAEAVQLLGGACANCPYGDEVIALLPKGMLSGSARAENCRVLVRCKLHGEQPIKTKKHNSHHDCNIFKRRDRHSAASRRRSKT